MNKKQTEQVKKVKRVVRKNVKQAQIKGAELQKLAMKEYAKVKKQMDETTKKVEAYVKKNPEKAAAIAAGVGMALGAVAGILAGRSTKKKKK